ncbi:MAG: hypothetical protein HRU01_21575 [Myxococcales bacterium]|nr:hypothetical protein [Myxococcales bacterium]
MGVAKWGHGIEKLLKKVGGKFRKSWPPFCEKTARILRKVGEKYFPKIACFPDKMVAKGRRHATKFEKSFDRVCEKTCSRLAKSLLGNGEKK